MTSVNRIRSLPKWIQERERIRETVRGLLGIPKDLDSGDPATPPGETVDIQIREHAEEELPFEQAGYVRKKISYSVDEWWRVEAWLFVPEDAEEDTPAIVCCHSRHPAGKDESAGLGGNKALAFAKHFARLGFITIAPDAIGAGDRIGNGLAPFDTTNHYVDTPGMSALGRMLWDHARAIDTLGAIRKVDPERIGVAGHGLGGINALLLAAFDQRVQACVASNPFIRFADDPEPSRWVKDGPFQAIPALESAVASGEYPFDWEDVLCLAAPTPLLLMAPQTPSDDCILESVTAAVKSARAIYRLLGETDAVQSCEFTGDVPGAMAMAMADDWFDHWL